MADAKLTVLGLGKVGVVVDRNTIDPDLPAGAFKIAENAFHDPSLGHFGAVRKRPGLKQFNLTNAGGPILGGIAMAVAGTGGAPVSGGGGSTAPSGASQPTGAGNGTGAPGGTTSGGPVTTTSPGAPLFNGGSPLFSGKRLLLIGANNNTAGTGRGDGWLVTSTGANDPAQLITATPPSTPGVVYFWPPTNKFKDASGKPYVFDAGSRWLYYTKAHTQTTGTQATVYKTNGATDVLVATIPIPTATAAHVNDPSDTTVRSAITGMCGGPFNLIYLAVKDKAGGQTTAGNYGRIFQLDTVSGALTKLDEFAHLPYCVCYFDANHAGAVYYGLFDLVSGELQQDTPVSIYANNGAGAQVDTTIADGEAVTAMIAFPGNDTTNQLLFAGLGVNKASPTFAPIYFRQRSPLGTSGAWTASMRPVLTDVNNEPALAGNYWSSFAEFNGKLYAAWYGRNACAIYELTPNFASTTLSTDGAWDGGGTWAVRYMTDTTGHTTPFALFVDDGKLYAVAQLGAQGIYVFVTTDGVTWTDKSANFNAGTYPALTGQYALPILAGFDQ